MILLDLKKIIELVSSHNQCFISLNSLLTAGIGWARNRAFYLKPTKPFNIEVSICHSRPTIDIFPVSLEESEEEREEESEEPVINIAKTFKSDECVICLTNPPYVLFCNCRHLCLCVECDEAKILEKCPVCKTKNTIKRTIEYKIFSSSPRKIFHHIL